MEKIISYTHYCSHPTLMFVGMGEPVKKGDNLILATFGGGFTWGATWVKWGYGS